MRKKIEFYVAFVTHMQPMSVHKKYQPIRYSRLAGYRQHIYMNVLFYYIDKLLLSFSLRRLFNEILSFSNYCP